MAWKWATVSIYHLEKDKDNTKKLVIDKENIIVNEKRDLWNEAFSFSNEQKYKYREFVTKFTFIPLYIDEIRLSLFLSGMRYINLDYIEKKICFDIEFFGFKFKINKNDNEWPLKDVSSEDVGNYINNFENTKLYEYIEKINNIDKKEFKRLTKRYKKEMKKR